MIKAFINFLKKLLFKENTMAFIPTPFDQHPNPFSLVESFIEKEFYLLMYKMIDKPPKEIFEKCYEKSFLSFILMFSYTIKDEKTNNEIEKTLIEIKQYFYRELVQQCILKISFHLKTIFYRYYNRNSLPKIELIKTEKYKSLLKKIEFLFKKDSKIYNLAEQNLIKVFIDISLEEDEQLVDYILDWAKIKFDLISTEIILIKEKILNEDHKYAILKNYPLDWWGGADKLRNSIEREDIIMEMVESLNNKIEYSYFISNLNRLFSN